VKTPFDPADPTSRHHQIINSVQAKLDEAAVARAALGPTADEVALLNSLRGISRQELTVQAARLAKVEADRLAAIARAVARIPEDA
jgi:hypothetical protein